MFLVGLRSLSGIGSPLCSIVKETHIKECRVLLTAEDILIDARLIFYAYVWVQLPGTFLNLLRAVGTQMILFIQSVPINPFHLWSYLEESG
jgi:hypothetical protein